MAKRYFLVFIGCIGILGCGRVKKSGNHTIINDTPETGVVTYKRVNNHLLNTYRSYLMHLDSNRFESSTIAVKKYIELFKNEDQNTRDSAFFVFYDSFYTRLTNRLDSLHNTDTTIKCDSLIIASNQHLPKLSAKLTQYQEKLRNNGFMVYMSEGDTYIGEDLDFVSKWFYSFISPPLKDYLSQINKENKQGFEEDASLIISPYQLADRSIWWEKFADKNNTTIVADKAKELWKGYLGTLMEGMDNTPIIEIGSPTLNVYYKTAYKRIQNTYPTSRTNKLITPYFHLLVRGEKVKADALLKVYHSKGIIN